MKSQITKESLFAYFSGTAGPLQKKLISEWLDDSNSLEYYYQCLEEWIKTYPQFSADTEAGLQKYIEKMHLIDQTEEIDRSGRGKSTVPQVTPFIQLKKTRSFRLNFHNNLNNWLWIAAGFLFLLINAFVFKDQILTKTYTTAFGKLKTVVLSEGSVVTLNANSVLKVPRFGFGWHTREVFLQGEAEFSVTHTADNQRFVVKTSNGLLVEVFGTEFVVYTRAHQSKVSLKSGKVKLYPSPDHKPMLVEPGDIVTVNPKGTIQRQIKQRPETFAAWKENKVVFDHTSLLEITFLLKENFGAEVHIADSSLIKRRVSGRFQAQTADELLKVLAEMMHMEITCTKDSTYILHSRQEDFF